MKKKILCCLLACVLMVFVAACRPNEDPQDSVIQEESSVKLYWNVDRNEFVGDSSAGMNSRQREADGFYSVRFAVDGQQVTYKVEKARLLETIDSMDIMGLEIDDQGVITAVHDPKDITGGEVASLYYVVIASDTTVTVSADEALETDYQFFDINENTGIYNVTGMDPVGHKDVAITSDRIRAFKNSAGEITHIFIVERYGYWPGETVMKHCEHCKQEVQWRVWEEKNALPTDSAHWILDNKVTLSAQHKIGANREIILDLNGYTVTGPDSKRVYALTGENAYLAIMDSSEAGSGKIIGSGSPDNGSVIYIRYGTFELFNGIIDASEIATVQYASAVRVNTDCVFNMYGGQIIGGKVIAPENPEDKVTNSGYGGTLYVTGTMNMYDGIITGGSCIESGGNIFVGKAGTLNLYGGQVTNGYAGKKGGNIAGTGKVNIYAATISGGSAKIYGGNFFVGKGGLVTLADDAAFVSSGKADQGGNIYIENGAAVQLDAGTLKYGYSAAHGGSIAVYGTCYLGAGKVMKGNAAEHGGNIFVGKTGVLTVGGAAVVDGTAGKKGGNIAGTGNVVLRGSYISGGKAKEYGGNLFSGKGAKVTVSGGVAISKGTAKQGGNAYIENGATVSMGSGYMKNGNATLHGGSVAVYGVFNLTGGTITQNTAQEQGGNIFVGKAGTLNIKGGSVEKGVAGTKGGNIAGTGTFNLLGGKIIDGSAKDYGGNLFVSGTVHMSGGSIVGGKSVNGGGVAVNGAAFTMTGGVIQGGEATQDGGCVYIARNVDGAGNTLSLGSFTMHSGEISGGTAERYGGNVFTGKECTFTMIDGKVLDGTSAQKGGNINLTGTVVMEGGLVSGGQSKNGGNINTAGTLQILGGTIQNGTVSNSTKYDRNIFVEGGSFTVSGGSIAGGVRIKKTSGAVLTDKANITNDQGFENLTLDKGIKVSLGELAEGALIGINTTSSEFATDAVETDVSYFVSNVEGKVVVYEDGKLYLKQEENEGDDTQPEIIDWTSGNSLPTAAGKYRLTQAVTLTETANLAADVQLDLNGFTVNANGNQVYNINAGGILTITDTVGTGKITGASTSGNGGTVYISAGGVFNLYGGTIEGGQATDGTGGNIYIQAGTTAGVFNMYGGTVTGGEAKQGGNIYAAAGSTTNAAAVCNLYGGTVENGTAATGGNVCALGEFHMTDGAITGGTATGNATSGNVYTKPGENGCSFTMTGGTITGLVRVNSTGSVSLGGTAKIAGGETNLTLSDKPATLTTTGFGEGAEIFVNLEYDAYAADEKHFGVIGAAGDEQYIQLDGEGEIAVTDSKLYLKQEENEEEDDTQSDVIDWTSDNSLPTTEGKYRLTAAVTVSSASTTEQNVQIYLDLNGFTVTGNNNNRIYVVDAGTTLTITDTSTEATGAILANRESTADAGAIYIKGAGATFNLEGGTIDASGVSVKSGAAVYVAAGTTFNMTGGTITGGTATGNGGNIYVAAQSTSAAAGIFNLYGGTVENGTAATGGNVCALGEFHMTDGAITGGTATGNATSGNVYTKPGENGCSFTMTGGTIAGLVRVNSTGSVSLGGTAKITGGETNLTLSDKPATLTTTGFGEGAEIFVNLEYDAYAADEKHFGVIGAAGDEQYIQLDGEGEITVTDSKLYLKQEEDDTQSDVIDWTSGDSLPTDAGKYRLTQTVTLTATANVAADVQLDLNGMTVNANGNQVYNVNAGGILTITDTVGTGKITGASTSGNGGTVYVSAGGVFNLYGGTMEGGQATDGTGGNIYIQAGSTGGVFNMYGGTVTGGKAKQGGNIYVAAGSTNATNNAAAVFNLYGGTVSAGEGTATAGNVAALGVMKMEGGQIKDGICNVTGNHKYAANVYTLPGKNKCTFTMTGGVITGWVRVNNAGSFTLGGTAQITNGTENASTNNTASGIYVSTNGATVTVDSTNPLTTGAEIYLSDTGNDPIVKGTIAAEYQGFFKCCEDGTLSFDESGIHAAAE